MVCKCQALQKPTSFNRWEIGQLVSHSSPAYNVIFLGVIFGNQMHCLDVRTPTSVTSVDLDVADNTTSKAIPSDVPLFILWKSVIFFPRQPGLCCKISASAVLSRSLPFFVSVKLTASTGWEATGEWGGGGGVEGS